MNSPNLKPVTEDDEPCTMCGTGIAVDEGLCADCIDDLNGQFGVGA